MLESRMQEISEMRRYASPVTTPQALAWKDGELWLSSRDLGTLQQIEPETGNVLQELDPPGVVWAAVATDRGWRFTVGKGLNDDRYVYSYSRERGFEKLFACPDFAGSYLSFDGDSLYFSQWYKGEIHEVDDEGKIRRTIQVGAEISGHVFVDGTLYVVRGHENTNVPGKAEEWRLARIDPAAAGKPDVEDVAVIPYASRSVAYDGERFWSNHRAANEIVSFALPT